jgi:hypothetical protein
MTSSPLPLFIGSTQIINKQLIENYIDLDSNTHKINEDYDDHYFKNLIYEPLLQLK